MQYTMILSSDSKLQIELNIIIQSTNNRVSAVFQSLHKTIYAFPYRCFKVTNIMFSIHSTGTTPLGKTKDFSIRIIKCNTNLSKC